MTAFLVVAGLLLAGALLFVLPPLAGRSTGRVVQGADSAVTTAAILRGQLVELDAERASGTIDAEQYGRARAEIERRALDDLRPPESAPVRAAAAGGASRSAIIVGAAVPIAAILLYMNLGNLEGLQSQPHPGVRAGAHAVTPEQVRVMVERLAARLGDDPSDVNGWLMLARSRIALGEFAEAARGYAKAAELRPRDAQVLADYADTLAMAQGRKLAGEPESIIQMALAADPRHPKALALAGSAAFEKQAFKQAIDYWQRLAALAPPDSEFGRSVQGSIDDAKRRLAGDVGKPIAASAGAVAPRISGTIRIDAKLAGQAAPQDTLFVFARAADGPRAPLAILRKRVGDLPMDFALDDSLAMNPSLKLSSFDRLVVTARVSRSGQAAAQPGDLEGSSEPVRLGAAPLAIEINRIVRE